MHAGTAGEVSLASNWPKSRVHDALDKAQREEIVGFLSERYTERFFSPIHTLRQAPGGHKGFGFAVMALCCLLIETLQCYRQGLPSSDEGELKKLETLQTNGEAPPAYRLVAPFHAGSRNVFCEFFKRPEHQRFFPEVDGRVFYEAIRCGLLHQAQTKDGWRIIQSGTFWDPAPTKSINRDKFSQRLEECFRSYLQDLKDEPSWDKEIWKAARKKIWWLIQIS